jgi:RimJ/RimL family protein N-acetyltransferase
MLQRLTAKLRSYGVLKTLSLLRKKVVRIQRHRLYSAKCSDAEEPQWLPDERVILLSASETRWNPTISEQLVAISGENRDYLDAVSRNEAEGLVVLHGEKVVHHAFLLYQNKTARLLGASNEIGLIGHAFTISDYRGRGCHARSVAARIKMAERAGLDKVISVTSYENTASQNGLLKGGMQYDGSMEMLVLLNLLVVRYKRPDDSVRWCELCW